MKKLLFHLSVGTFALAAKSMLLVVHKAWERLEKAEHERELALRTELIRQEKLEQLARRFDRKAAMRETWLSENQRLVSQVKRWNCELLLNRAKHHNCEHLLVCWLFSWRD